MLSIGVASQLKRSGFASLQVCATDARVIYDRFKSNEPLNADMKHLRLLENPSRNQTLDAIETLCEDAHSDDRLFVFFSGHGVRIKDELYLVPHDALAADDPAQLVALFEVEALLEQSPAKQKFIFIDACYSGAEITKFKGIFSAMSANELSKLVHHARGAYILSSSGQDETSVTQSKDGRVSLFTDYLAQALAGAPDALDDGILTFESLANYVRTNVQRAAREFGYSQRPTVSQKSQGLTVLGDYRPAADAEAALDLRGPQDVQELIFEESDRRQPAKNLVGRAATWHNQDYIEKRVNEEMEILDDSEIRRLRADLRRALDLKTSSERNTIYFDGGTYTIRWESIDEKTGRLVHEVTLDNSWLERLDDVPLLLNSLALNTKKLTLRLGATIDVARAYAAFTSDRFVLIEDGLPDEFTVRPDATQVLRVTVQSDALAFEGFTPAELFGDGSNGEKVSLVQLALTVATSVLQHAERRRIRTHKRGVLKKPL